MEIEFDPAKSERNQQARGFGFERASAFDFSTALIWIDSRNAYPEPAMPHLAWWMTDFTPWCSPSRSRASG
jgi:uncharacterized DUF497 family protein